MSTASNTISATNNTDMQGASSGLPASSGGFFAGGMAPDFTLPSAASEKMVSLRDYRGQDVLLMFMRGTWCPSCRKQLASLQEAHPRLVAAKVAVLAVSTQSLPSLRWYQDAQRFTFQMLADESRSTAKAYGVHYWLSPEGFNLAKPSLFILDKSGCITFRYVGSNMSDLPVTSILEKFLQTLGDTTK